MTAEEGSNVVGKTIKSMSHDAEEGVVIMFTDETKLIIKQTD